MSIFPNLRVAAAPNVLIREIGGEAVILDLKSERYLGLDETGTRMWQLLTQSESIQSAHDALIAEYEVDADRLSRDLADFLDKLKENGLVDLLPADNPSNVRLE